MTEGKGIREAERRIDAAVYRQKWRGTEAGGSKQSEEGKAGRQWSEAMESNKNCHCKQPWGLCSCLNDGVRMHGKTTH